MPSFHSTRRVKHSPDKMFDLVADVENYPRFVPLCESLSVRLRRPLDDGREVMVADMTVAYTLYRETFTSKVTLDRAKAEILVEYLDGPFKHLENRWTFEPDGEGCKVGFWIAYEFKSRAMGALMGAMFDKAFRKFSEAFEKRADAVYG
jgi:coenzyme Q-binding protein COQ10